MTENAKMRKVDQNELRVNSALVLTVMVTSFVTNRWELVAFQAGVMFLTTLNFSFGPYVLLYRLILRPLGIIKPDLRVDNPEPHRLATFFGTIVSSTATYFLVTGRPTIGWGFAWLLIILGAANLAGWCAGCFTYYTLIGLDCADYSSMLPLKEHFPGRAHLRIDNKINLLEV